MIDLPDDGRLANEPLYPFVALATKVPPLRGGRPVNRVTLHRWATCGIRGIKLEYLQVGGTRCSSVEALQRFYAALRGEQTGEPVPAIGGPARRTDHRRERRLEAVSQELAALGF